MTAVNGLTAAWQGFLDNAELSTPCDCSFFYNPEARCVEYRGTVPGLTDGWIRIPTPYTAVDVQGVPGSAKWAGFASRLTACFFETWIKRYEANQKEAAHA